jgi:2-keto-4-pentenoate hydratase/2-oxohepta-3-ene-1,7-dioic acid hydratase in catechol pathway
MGIWQPLHDVVRKLIEIRQNTRNWYDLLPLSSHYMKLIRFGSPDHEKPGVLLDDGRRIDVSAFGADYDEGFFGGDGLQRLAAWVKVNAAMAPTVDESVRLGPCIARPSKIVCVGLNYTDHAKESGMPIPAEPILFFKSTTSIVGPNDDLVIPRDSKKTDWEVELAIIIGKKAQYVSEADAMQHVAGYALHNDYSEREWQLERGGQWVKGKSCDTFAPLGPFLATADEIPDPHSLPLWLKVNGVTRQNSSTAQMIFGVPKLVSYISQFMTLLPGDVISTGTPPGVGLGLKPEPVFLKPGDVVELGISGLGESQQVARALSGMA